MNSFSANVDKVTISDDEDHATLNADEVMQEYQDFVYIVSHDLQAPIRHVSEFSKLLVKHIGDDLDERGQTYVKFVQNAVNKLSDMQDILLTFSRITTQAKDHEDIDGHALIKSTLSALNSHIDESVSIHHNDNLPPIHGEARQLKLALYHLLKNALTYHEEGAKKEIALAIEVRDQKTVFTVTDNGIGIDPKFHKDVFQMFRRLHAPEEYGGGHGAGLTLVKKIVERHGGRVSITSEPGEGTAVSFYIPAPGVAAVT